jgi:hypothetical protein
MSFDTSETTANYRRKFSEEASVRYFPNLISFRTAFSTTNSRASVPKLKATSKASRMVFAS